MYIQYITPRAVSSHSLISGIQYNKWDCSVCPGKTVNENMKEINPRYHDSRIVSKGRFLSDQTTVI